MSLRTTRRRFLKTSAIATAGYWVAGGVKARASTSPNEQIQFACIGIGGKGSGDSSDAKRYGEVVAMCDIDDRFLTSATKRLGKSAKIYHDYRKMLEEMGDKIDAVTVSTPDHHHGPAAAMAMRMGKHCFCQKPLTRTIYEARLLADLAREKKLATQMGNHGTAEPGLRRAAAQIRAGMLGKVKEVHVWTNRPKWAQGGPRPGSTQPPNWMHWKEFIGPAPDRPFAAGYHPFSWRGWWDFGTGALGDMACHTVNMPYAALDLRDPVSIEAETSGHNKDSFPKWSKIRFEFAATSSRPALTLFWYDGGMRPAPDIVSDISSVRDDSKKDQKQITGRLADSGCIIIGDKGYLVTPNDYGAEYTVQGGAELIDVEFEKSPGHFTEWVEAIEGGKPAMSNFPDYAGPLTEMILTGNLAVWLGRKIVWDGSNMKATNAPELNALIKPELHHGYTL